MKLALAGQRVGGGHAEIRAVKHQTQMLRPGMLAADLQAVRYCCAQAEAVAPK